MSTATKNVITPPPDTRQLPSLPGYLLRLLGLAIIDALALALIYLFAQDQVWPLAATLAVITVIVNVINLWPALIPLRWMSPAFAIIILLVIYPLLYTVYVAFTNYGDGHILTKVQVLEQLEGQRYLPEGGTAYRWTAFSNEADEYALWLIDDAGGTYFITQDDPLTQIDLAALNLESGSNLPDDFAYDGYTPLNRIQAASLNRESLTFGEGETLIGLKSASTAGPFVPRYTYDSAADAVIDQSSGEVYQGNPATGNFTAASGDTLSPGYWVTIGLNNFERFFNSPALSGPLLRIFGWTIGFAILSVLSTFALGLLLAIVLDGDVPGKKIIRSFLIVPYAIPGVISILTWRGMFNPNFGVVSNSLDDIFGNSPDFFGDPGWAKVAILFVNLWLGFPYMMLICSGALQSIPSEIYEAARVDGASIWLQFRKLTLPLLLISVGPLLIGSFTFNFNNFTIIEAFNEGRPFMTQTTTPAGHTDILISYTYRLAFGSGRGADYGYAAAITIIIFIMVAAVTLFQFRFTRQLEEVSENV